MLQHLFSQRRSRQGSGHVTIPVIMLKRVLPHFGEAVTAVLKEHGLSDRAAQYRTGIDRITMADMRNGYVPRMEQVVRFARGFGLSVGDWLEAAGYERLDETVPPQPLSNAERLGAFIEHVARTYPGAEQLTIRLTGGLGRLHELTPEEMDDLLASIERNVAEILREEKNKA